MINTDFKKINKVFFNIALLLVGGIGITLSGINWHIGIIVWLAPFFLLMYTRNAKWYQLLFFFLVIAVSGMISQTSNNLLHLPVVNIINGLSFGVLYSIAYIIDKILYKKNDRFYYSLIFPSSIVLVEYAVSTAIGTWGTIAHTQFEIKPLLHLSSITGIFGISFIVAWFPSVLNWVIEKKNEYRAAYKGLVIYSCILFLVLLFGELRMGFYYPNGKTVKVAAIISETDIHNFAEKEKDAIKNLATDYNAEIPVRLFSDSLAIRTLINRTFEASVQGAKIIVWNEIALVLNQGQKRKLLSEIQSLCLKDKVYVLAAFLEECAEPNKKPFNNKSVLVSPEGKILWEYLKSFVHPYAEAPVINSGNFKIPFIQTEYGKIGNVICSDLDMPNYMTQTGEKAIDILLTPAYDWHEITPLHTQMACLNAIQYGVSIVRSNGKGLTAIYDYMGNTISSVNTLTSDTKIVYANVPEQSVKTFYSYFGDLIIYLATIFLMFLIIQKITKRKNKPDSRNLLL